jgi:hypothetical protein
MGKHRTNCGKNFETNVAMGNSEKDMGKECAVQVRGENNLQIGTLIADGDGHIAKGVEEGTLSSIDRQHCARHLTKSISRNIMRGTLACLPGPTQKLIQKQKRDLAKFIEKRCAWEYKIAHKTHKKNINRLVTVCTMIQRGIIACIEGDVTTCKRVSLVCKAHKGREGGSIRVGIICMTINSAWSTRIRKEHLAICIDMRMAIYSAWSTRIRKEHIAIFIIL